MNIGQDLDQLNSRFVEMISTITGVRRTAEDCLGLMGGTYVVTGDTLLKMLAIFVRVRCGVPVVLMGECGCGKTALIKYLCAFLNAPIVTLDVHGGTTEADILQTFAKAEEAVIAQHAKLNGGGGGAGGGGGGEEKGAGGDGGDGMDGGVPLPVVPDGEWPCDMCTFMNASGGVTCEQCDETRPGFEAVVLARIGQEHGAVGGGHGEGDAQRGDASVWVFLDEINTCTHMGLINEVSSLRPQLSDTTYSSTSSVVWDE